MINYNTHNLDTRVIGAANYGGAGLLLRCFVKGHYETESHIDFILTKSSDGIFVEMEVTTGEKVHMSYILMFMNALEELRSIYPTIWRDHVKEEIAA